MQPAKAPPGELSQFRWWNWSPAVDGRRIEGRFGWQHVIRSIGMPPTERTTNTTP
jgi:hypothetical protein